MDAKNDSPVEIIPDARTPGRPAGRPGGRDMAMDDINRAQDMDAAGEPVNQYARIGHDLFERGMYADAVEAFEVALSKHPDHPAILCNLGIACMFLRQWKRAENSTRSYLASVPDDTAALVRLGIILRRRGLHEQSILALRQALRVDPHMAFAHRELGRSLLAAGQTDEARAAFRKALQIKPGMVEAWCGLGKVYERLNSPAQVRQVLEQAQRHVPPDQAGPIFAQLGKLFRKQKEWPRAQVALSKAISCGEADPLLILEFGYVLLKMNNRQAALEQADILEAMGSDLAERLRATVEGRPAVLRARAADAPETAAGEGAADDEDATETTRPRLSELFEKTWEGKTRHADAFPKPTAEQIPELFEPPSTPLIEPEAEIEVAEPLPPAPAPEPVAEADTEADPEDAGGSGAQTEAADLEDDVYEIDDPAALLALFDRVIEAAERSAHAPVDSLR
jgi:tetratricopeptide (TPR) repeat protein